MKRLIQRERLADKNGGGRGVKMGRRHTNERRTKHDFRD